MDQSVAKILIEYLEKHGFDGIYQAGECACEIGDLAPCDSMCLDCEAGYKNYCEHCAEYDDCGTAGNLGMSREDGWCIGPDRKKQNIERGTFVVVDRKTKKIKVATADTARIIGETEMGVWDGKKVVTAGFGVLVKYEFAKDSTWKKT